jgi:hypothetical protein
MEPKAMGVKMMRKARMSLIRWLSIIVKRKV